MTDHEASKTRTPDPVVELEDAQLDEAAGGVQIAPPSPDAMIHTNDTIDRMDFKTAPKPRPG